MARSYRYVAWAFEEDYQFDDQQLLIQKILKYHDIRSIDLRTDSVPHGIASQEIIYVSPREDLLLKIDNIGIRTIAVSKGPFDIVSSHYLYELLVLTLTNEEIIEALVVLEAERALSFAIALLAFEMDHFKPLKGKAQFDSQILLLFLSIYQSIAGVSKSRPDADAKNEELKSGDGTYITESQLKTLERYFPQIIECANNQKLNFKQLLKTHALNEEVRDIFKALYITAWRQKEWGIGIERNDSELEKVSVKKRNVLLELIDYFLVWADQSLMALTRRLKQWLWLVSEPLAKEKSLRVLPVNNDTLLPEPMSPVVAVKSPLTTTAQVQRLTAPLEQSPVLFKGPHPSPCLDPEIAEIKAVIKPVITIPPLDLSSPTGMASGASSASSGDGSPVLDSRGVRDMEIDSPSALEHNTSALSNDNDHSDASDDVTPDSLSPSLPAGMSRADSGSSTQSSKTILDYLMVGEGTLEMKTPPSSVSTLGLSTSSTKFSGRMNVSETPVPSGFRKGKHKKKSAGEFFNFDLSLNQDEHTSISQLLGDKTKNHSSHDSRRPVRMAAQ